MTEENARISSTMLGPEDHGIFTAWLMCEFDGAGQGFGGYGMRYGGFAAWFIQEVLRVTGADCWEKIPGRYIRVRRDHGKIHAIGNIENDPLKTRVKGEWFDPSTYEAKGSP
jgi:hypothetical protein